MSTRNRTLGGLGMAVAALVALSVTACDPYIQADTSPPAVIGLMMVDTNYNEVVPPDSTGCTAPYPQVDKTWADQVFPGLCNPANVDFGIPTVCPVLCYPPRMGPAYAPLFTGNIGGSYQTTLGGQLASYTYTTPAAWALGAVNPVPPLYYDASNELFVYGQIRVLFNKLMDGASIQPDPADCTAAEGIHVYKNGTEVFDHAVCYVPNSDTAYWGGSLTVTPPGLDETMPEFLDPNTTYRVTGDVKDQQGNPLTFDVTVRTGDNVIDIFDAPTNLEYSKNPATYTVGKTITDNTPSNDDGRIVIYSITPALPAGLKLSPLTGIIYGKPTVASPTTTYTVTGTNPVGSTTASLVITVE
jgi:Putative Ig domain